MNNRFKSCETLIDLYNVLQAEIVEYCNLTKAEKSSLVKTYNAALSGISVYQDVNSLTLTKDIFDNICCDIMSLGKLASERLDEAGKEEKAKKTGENGKMKKHGGIITKADKAVKNISGKVAETVVRAGEDANEFKERCDKNITDIKDSLGGVLEMLDDLTGVTALKEELYSIIYTETKGTKSRRGFFDAASECRQAVKDYINNILRYSEKEDDLKTVVQLRFIIGQDDDGNDIEGHQCIFTAALRGIAWICRKVCRKLRDWFGTNEETNVFGKVGASIASVFGIAANVIKNVLEIVIDAVIFVGSYVLSAVLNCISVAVEKVKGWFSKVKEKFSKPEEKEDVEDTEENLEEFMEADVE